MLSEKLSTLSVVRRSLRGGCILLLLMALQACGKSENTAFEEAQTAGTSDAYQKFITEFPKSKLVSVAQEKLLEARYSETQQANTEAAWQEFLKAFPKSKYEADALYALEHLSFMTAEKANTKEAYEKFLADYPAGSFAPKARQNLEGLTAPAATPAPAPK